MKTEELQHFDLLKELGVWDELEQLRKELRDSEKLFSEVSRCIPGIPLKVL